jgi:hypothetical protein
MRERIAIYSLWRDSEPHINRTLSQLEDLESLDIDFEYYFYENDSVDNTEAILRKWISTRKGKFLSEKISAPKFGSVTDLERMQRLCDYRNKCKDLLEDSESKYTLLLDSDIFFSKENLLRHLKIIQELPDCCLLTPNVRQNIPDLAWGDSEDSYYDVYPFFDMEGKSGLYFVDCPFRNGIDRMNWKLGIPVKCASAFGGFALTYTEFLKKVKWSTKGLCDHVEFCLLMNQYGHIYVDPLNKVKTKISIDELNLNSIKNIGTNQRIEILSF